MESPDGPGIRSIARHNPPCFEVPRFKADGLGEEVQVHSSPGGAGHEVPSVSASLALGPGQLGPGCGTGNQSGLARPIALAARV